MTNDVPILSQAVDIETVTVGNPGNAGELSGGGAGGIPGQAPDCICGAVGYTYDIGKYEVTAGQYTQFLNAVAATDTYGLYHTEMWSHNLGCKIQRQGSPGMYTYTVAADWANRPVNFVSWGDAARFSNWLHNGQPTGDQNLSTTEDGSYYLNGATSNTDLLAVTRKADATWVIPSEDEWYKAAYHMNDGPSSNYYDYPTGSNTEPSNALIDPDPGNNANFLIGMSYTIGGPYHRTEVGAFENSESPYGTFDQGGNVWEWNEAIISSHRGLRGSSWYTFGGLAGPHVMHAATRISGWAGVYGWSTGFRVVRLSPEPENQPPNSNAGANVNISSDQQSLTILLGTALDPDGDLLSYRWLDGGNELSPWQSVGTNGECPLDLNSISIGVGSYTLTLEVTDGEFTVSDEIILTIENSAPHAAATGGGVYEIYSEVILGGNVSDFDGDLLSYEWKEGADLLYSDSVPTIQGGTPVALPSYSLWYLNLGVHAITLQVDDGINDPASSEISLEIVDTTVPTLAPVANRTILWPPNHGMVDIVIEANASDNSGLPVTLAVTVTSNEPEEGLGDEDMAPDWTEPQIDQYMGTINLQLRSERSENGDGRIYTLTVIATDETGNSSAADINIIVPHDKSKK